MRRILNAAAILFFLASFSWIIISLQKIISGRAPDFEVLFLTARDLPLGKNPYLNPEVFTGVGYPPNTLLFYLPLTPLPYQVAQALFILLSFASVVGIVYLSLRIVKKKVSWKWFLPALSLAFLSFPVKFTLGMGQNNSIAFLLLLLAFFLYLEKRERLAGIFLGLSIAFKTIFAFFLLFYLIKKAWRVLFWSFAPILLSIILVEMVSDLSLYLFWWREIIPPLFNMEGREIYYNQGFMGFVSRLTEDIGLKRQLSLIFSAGVIGIISWLTLKKKDEKLQFSLFTISLPLVDTLSWQHHFLWLTYPVILLAVLSFKKRKLFLLVATAYILISYNIRQPELYSGALSAFILSNVFFGALLLLILNLYWLKKT